MKKEVTEVEATDIQKARTLGSQIIPALRSSKWKNSCRALDAYSKNPYGLYGTSGRYSGLMFAMGFGGTGFKVAPAVGKRLALSAQQFLRGRASA